MTNFLIRLFIRNYEDMENMKVRTSYGKLAGWTGIFCNGLLFLGKLLVSMLSGSVAVLADGINNLSDASSNIITILGFHMGSKPADQDHPYGHARYEYLSGLLVAVFIMVIGVELLKTSYQKVRNPEPVDFSWVMVAVLAVSIIVKIWMAVFNRSLGKRIHSETLIATAADSRNDVISTGAVLLASLISHYTNLELDGWMGLLVAVFILYSGVGLVKDTLDPLLGKAPDQALVDHIYQKILSYNGVLGTHDLMIHDYGPGRLFASVHVEMAAEADVIQCHNIIDTIEKDFLEQDNLNMIIHFDPIITAENADSDMRIWLNKQVKRIDGQMTVHDLRIIKGDHATDLVFDCLLPETVVYSDKEIRQKIQELVEAEYPEYRCQITLDKNYAAMPHTKEQETYAEES